MRRGRKEHQAPPDSLSLGDKYCVAEAFACVRPRGNVGGGRLGFVEMGVLGLLEMEG